MAKFAIALCILLVAYGAQALDFNEIKEGLEDKLQQIKDAINDKWLDLEDARAIAAAKIREWLAEQEEKIQEKISALEAKREELEAKAADFAECASGSRPDLAAAGEFLRSTLKECVREATADIAIEFEAVKAAGEEVKSSVTAIAASAKACVADNESKVDAAACLWDLAKSQAVDVASLWADLLVRIAPLVNDLANIRDNVKSCAKDAALDGLAQEVNDYLAQLQECISAA